MDRLKADNYVTIGDGAYIPLLRDQIIPGYCATTAILDLFVSMPCGGPGVLDVTLVLIVS